MVSLRDSEESSLAGPMLNSTFTPMTRQAFTFVDTHTGGEPTRTLIDGVPPIHGATHSEKVQFVRDNLDWLRTAMIFEPRGHGGMSGVILTEPCDPAATIGVIFVETGEHPYPPMCGHGAIGVATALIEAGIVDAIEPVTEMTLETPGGLVRVAVNVHQGTPKSVTVRSVPAFVMAQDVTISPSGTGEVVVDVAYGGNVHAILPAADAGLILHAEHSRDIVLAGRAVRDAVNASVRLRHPQNDRIDRCTHVQFFGGANHSEASARNVVFYGDDALDRSPCGTGTAAKLAALYAKGQVGMNKRFVHESMLGTLFEARIVEETRVGAIPAVVVEVTGRAFLTATGKMLIDPDDPLKEGFLVGSA